MAVKSTIEIEILDEQFKQFEADFEQHKASLADLPKGWKDALKQIVNNNNAARQLRDTTAGFTKEEIKAAKEAKKLADESKKISVSLLSSGKAATFAAKGLKDGAKASSAIAGNILNATANLMKWGGILTGVVSGAGMFGFANLTEKAGNLRFQSQGLGMNAGEMQSAQVNYSSLVSNPKSTLSAVRDALSDVTKYKVFGISGINPQGKSADEVMPALLRKMQQVAKTTPTAALSTVMNATGLSDIFSIEDATRLKELRSDEIDSIIKRNKADAAALGLDDIHLKQYQDLDKQFSRFGMTIQKVAIEGLTGLAKPLENLSDASAKAFEKLMKSDKIPPLIDKLASGITKLADYIDSGKFESDFDSFMSDAKEAGKSLKEFGDGVKSVLEFLGFSTPSAASSDTPTSPSGVPQTSPYKPTYERLYDKTVEAWSYGIEGVADKAKEWGVIKGDTNDKKMQAIDYLQSLGRTKNEAIGITANLWGESNLNPMTYGGAKYGENKGGKSEAYGLMQWHKDRRAHYAAKFGHTMESVKDEQQALKEQLEFANWELSNNEAKGWEQTKQEGNSAGAIAGGFAKYIERPEDKAGAARDRSGHASVLAKDYEIYKAGQSNGIMQRVGGKIAAKDIKVTPPISYSDYKGKPIIIENGEKDINGQIKDLMTPRKPKPINNPQSSVMFNQNNGMLSQGGKLELNINNNTGGSAIVGASTLR